jgi:hypothetical protein
MLQINLIKIRLLIINNELIFQLNKLKNRYVTDGNRWTVDDTIFNSDTKLFLLVSLKLRGILCFIVYQYKVYCDIISSEYGTAV